VKHAIFTMLRFATRRAMFLKEQRKRDVDAAQILRHVDDAPRRLPLTASAAVRMPPRMCEGEGIWRLCSERRRHAARCRKEAARASRALRYASGTRTPSARPSREKSNARAYARRCPSVFVRSVPPATAMLSSLPFTPSTRCASADRRLCRRVCARSYGAARLRAPNRAHAAAMIIQQPTGTLPPADDIVIPPCAFYDMRRVRDAAVLTLAVPARRAAARKRYKRKSNVVIETTLQMKGGMVVV